MKKSVIISVIFVIVMSFIITGCKEEKENYKYEYDIVLNGSSIFKDVIKDTGVVNDYILNPSKINLNEIKLTFDVYEKPVRTIKYDPTDLIKNSFGVSTIYNDFTNGLASTEQVKRNNARYNHYSLTYTFKDVKASDVITIKMNDDVIKNLGLIENTIKIRFIEE